METITQTISLNGQTLQIEGTIEQPLFKCSDVIIRLLGYKESNKNRFYHDNKSIHKYIRTLSICEGIDTNLYFTELGLYRCLFTSKKEVAIEFQELVAQLLIDIRNGNIELLLKKQCETSDLLQSKNNEIFNYITQNQNLQQQVNDLTIKLNKTSQNVVIYDKQLENGKHYIGSTNNLYQRNRQHSRNSCNKHLREAYSNKENIRTRSLINIKCYSKDDIKYVERLSINQVPKQQLLNVALPNPNMENVTFDNTQQEEIKQQLGSQALNQIDDYIESIDDSIDQISEVQEFDEQSTLCELDDSNDSKWLFKYNQLLEYVKIHNQIPSYSHSNNSQAQLQLPNYKEIKSLSLWCGVQRGYKTRQSHVLTKYRQDMLELIPIWNWWKQQTWMEIFVIFKRYISDNLVYPRMRSDDQLEKQLGKWINCQRYIKRGKASYVMQPNRVQLLDSIDFIWDASYDWDVRYDQLIDYVASNKRLPSMYCNIDNDQDDEYKNAMWIKSQKQLKKKNKLDEEQISKLLLIPGFKFVAIHEWKDVYVDVQDFINRNKRLPSRTSKNQDEKYLAQWLHDQKTWKRQKKLNEAKQEKLLLLPGFKWPVPKVAVV